MRTINELLSVVLENFDRYYCNRGFCLLFSDLKYNKILNLNESSCLIDYLDNNKPKNLRRFLGEKTNHRLINGRYYWSPINKRARKRWLKKHIELTK